MSVHPTAIVDPGAEISEGVEIGPFSIIGRARIGKGSVVHSHVTIADDVQIGSDVEIFRGALIGKEPKGAGATARVPAFERKISIGDGCSIGPNSVIFYDVIIGNSTLLGDGASIREKCRIGTRCIISRYVTLNYEVTVGDRVKVMDYSHLTGHMVVGNDVFISTHVSTTNDNEIRSGYGEHIRGPVVEDGATIAANAILLAGVRIGAGAMLGAGALATKDVRPRHLAMGIPAREIKAVESGETVAELHDPTASRPDANEGDYSSFWNGGESKST